jgi:Ribosomal protein S9
MDKVILAVGRRKTSVARVVLTPGTGKVRVNGRDVNEYFNVKSLLPEVFKPLEITNLKDKFDIRAKCRRRRVQGAGRRD